MLRKIGSRRLSTRAVFNWHDPLNLRSCLTEEELLIQDSANAYCQEELLPGIVQANRNATFDPKIMKQMGELGLLGPTIQGYGCPGVGYVSYGLFANAVERIDSAYRSAMSVQSSLVMHPIYTFGTDEQKQKVRPSVSQHF